MWKNGADDWKDAVLYSAWNSPIKIIENEIYDQWNMQMEDGILKAVYNVGIHVDREELLKALAYDRNQYNMGYMDGVKEVCDRIANRLMEEAFDMSLENPDCKAVWLEKAIQIVKEGICEYDL